MSRLVPLVAVVLIAAFPPSVSAQQKASPDAPEVLFAHKGAKKVFADLEALLKLTNQKQQKQWKVLKTNLDVFVIGIDQNGPLRMDLIFPLAGPLRYRPSFPIANAKQFKNFRNNNLKPFGIKTLRIAPSLYKCKGQVFKGYMRYKFNFATFGEVKSDLPLNFNPGAPLAGLLMNYDLALRGTNPAAGAGAVAARRDWFQKQRKQLVAALKPAEGESKADFDLRKLLFEQQLDEAERFYAETGELTAGWSMDLTKMTGRGDMDLTAIPGTSLAKAVDLVGVNPSYFANVSRSKTPILSLRVNWPIDAVRQKNYLKLFAAVKQRELAKTNANSGLTAKQKAADARIAGLVENLLAANVNAAIFDTFIEVHPAGKHNTVVGAFRAADGKAMLNILKQLPDAHFGGPVTMGVAKEGNVDIHRVKLNLSAGSTLKMLLGDNVVFVGTSKDAVWFASGPNALNELVAAVKETAGPNRGKADDPFLDVFVKVGPWLELRDKARGKQGKPELRKIAREAFKPGQDGVTVQLRRRKNKVIGEMKVETDVLRFVGAMISKFSEENLDESSGKKKKKAKLSR